MPKKPSTYDVTHKKSAFPKQKIFFQVQAARLAASFETLTGSVALTGPEKFPHKATCVPVFFPWKSPKVAGRQSVLLKFLLETRLKSESFEPLIDFLAFLCQKLSKINKLFN